MHMPRTLRLAVVLGAVPLLVGALVYCTWRAMRWDWLMHAGMLIIILGVMAFVTGTIALVVHVRREFRAERRAYSRIWCQAILVGGLLLANFPAAVFFTLSAMDVVTRYTVRVHNESDRPIESLVLIGPGVRVELGPIAPGQHKKRHLQFVGKGSLDFSARQQEVQFGGEVGFYVVQNVGGNATIRIRQRGVHEIQYETN